ncbi:MAG: site-specific integrase [Kiloniellaceae bacterium]
MPRKAVNTDKQVADLKAEPAKYAVRVKDVPGLYVRVSPAGAKTFAAVARDPGGRQVWATLGGTELTLDEKQSGNVREKAREAIRRIKGGEPPFPAPPAKPDSFEAVATNWMTRHVKAKGLRSERDLQRQLDKYILPAWKKRAFAEIRKSDVARLLDEIEDDHGPVQADRVLATVRGIMRWHAARDDEYVCVVTGKLRRTDPKERRRKRVLDDDEIRVVWQVAAGHGPYGELVRLGLLTGQRLEKIAAIKWADVDAAGRWTIATEAREKGNGEVLPLPALAFDIIRQQPKIEGNPYVFAGRGKGHFKGYSKGKAALDAAIAAARAKAAGAKKADPAKHALPAWVFHDLRRTARSLLARAGVSTEIARRVLGHAEDAIQATYNRHSYIAERGDALNKLAALLQLIIDPPAGNVVELAGAR